MTQNSIILSHLENFGSITAKEAVECYGCYRLSARIAELRALGYNIKATTESGKNRYGEAVHYTRYSYGRSSCGD